MILPFFVFERKFTFIRIARKGAPLSRIREWKSPELLSRPFVPISPSSAISLSSVVAHRTRNENVRLRGTKAAGKYRLFSHSSGWRRTSLLKDDALIRFTSASRSSSSSTLSHNTETFPRTGESHAVRRGARQARGKLSGVRQGSDLELKYETAREYPLNKAAVIRSEKDHNDGARTLSREFAPEFPARLRRYKGKKGDRISRFSGTRYGTF